MGWLAHITVTRVIDININIDNFFFFKPTDGSRVLREQPNDNRRAKPDTLCILFCADIYFLEPGRRVGFSYSDSIYV